MVIDSISLTELFDGVRRHPNLARDEANELVQTIRLAFERQERLWQQANQDALQAMTTGLADRVRWLRQELAAREATVSNMTRYFETLVADLTERVGQDPKTRLMNFPRFIEHLSSFLALEQSAEWCAVGLVDIRSFKAINDDLGHALGDQVIDCVARLLRDQVRANDLLARESVTEGQDMHARFGGDEFCFLLPRLDSPHHALMAAERFRLAVEHFDWATTEPRLTTWPVAVDVGVVCLQLGPVETRRAIAEELAHALLAHADRAMYTVKSDSVPRVHGVTVQLTEGRLTPIDLPGEVTG